MSDGIGCRCAARSESECSCEDVDWTPRDLYQWKDRALAAESKLGETERKCAEYYGKLEDERTRRQNAEVARRQSESRLDKITSQFCGEPNAIAADTGVHTVADYYGRCPACVCDDLRALQSLVSDLANWNGRSAEFDVLMGRAKAFVVEKQTLDLERIEIARCPHCGALPRTDLMGHCVCPICGGIVTQPAPVAEIRAPSEPGYDANGSPVEG